MDYTNKNDDYYDNLNLKSDTDNDTDTEIMQHNYQRGESLCTLP